MQLWNKFHACDWEFTKNKVKAWIPIINKAGLYNWVILKGQKELDSDVLAYDFPSPPNTIGASFEDDAVSRIFENEIVALSNTALLDLIMIRIARHVEIISALP